MPPPNPPFPRRGVIAPKSPRPRRRDPLPPFFRTAEGRRLIFYGVVLAAFLGTMVAKSNPGPAAPQAPDSRAESRAANPPRSFAPPELLHQIRTLEDFTRSPHDSAIASTIRYLGSLDGPESRSREPDWTQLDIDDVLAHPEGFRGGLVKVRGQFAGIETREIDHPAVPGRFTYRGYVMCTTRAGESMVVWETATLPPEIDKMERLTLVEVKGVFLQDIQYEAAKGGFIRNAPFLVAHSVAIAPVSAAGSFRDKLFTPALIVLIILILATTLFLFQKSRRSVQAARYLARPPGPGR